MIQVYSHPRSGTNLLMAFIAKNFYPGRDLTGKGGVMGHWVDPVPSPSPWSNGALFGSHRFYDEGVIDGPACYIYRDGRDVAVSLWRTKAFLHPDWRDISFSEFLRRDLDWTGSPGSGIWYGAPIAEHWMSHLWSWYHACSADVLLVRYEDLVLEPAKVRAPIARHCDLTPTPELVRIEERVGPFPHEGQIGAWRRFFSDEDLAHFHQSAPPDFWGFYHEEA